MYTKTFFLQCYNLLSERYFLEAHAKSLYSLEPWIKCEEKWLRSMLRKEEYQPGINFMMTNL